MPIYEFYCVDCHRLFSFFSRGVDTEKRPACPRCGRPELARQVSLFAISKGRKEPEAPKRGPGPDLDDARLERVMESLASEAEHLDENDPRQAARLMRRLFEGAGMPVGAGMEEALRRMEAGENTEAIEEELGDVMDQDPFAGGEAEGKEGQEPKGSLARLRRRVLPPSVDPNLYEL